jgi:hypothetical protein
MDTLYGQRLHYLLVFISIFFIALPVFLFLLITQCNDLKRFTYVAFKPPEKTYDWILINNYQGDVTLFGLAG